MVSKSGKAVADAPVAPGTVGKSSKALQDLLHISKSKAGKAKCHKNEIDLSEFDLTIDFSMSTSMSYDFPLFSSKAMKAMTECAKYDEDLSQGNDESHSYDAAADNPYALHDNEDEEHWIISFYRALMWHLTPVWSRTFSRFS